MKNNMKKVFIYAYKEINLGDDLFIMQLINRYPETKFIMIADKQYQEIFSNHPNVQVYNKFNIMSKIRQKLNIYDKWERKFIQRCDYAVYIGGSIFMEYERWTDQYKWYQSLFDNKRLFFIGCNWGPCKTTTFYNNMKKVLSGMRDICFRDMISYNAFSELQNVRYAPDILFGTTFDCNIDDKKQIFISLIDCYTKEEGENNFCEYEVEYLNSIKDIIKYFVKKGYSVKLASFCKNENDIGAINKLISLLDYNCKKNVSVIDYDGLNINKVLTDIGNSEYVIASRFHAAILGLVARKKVLPIVYSDKTINVLSDIGFYGDLIDIRSMLDLDIDNVLQNLENWREPKKLRESIEKSQEHFSELDLVLKNSDKNN